MKTALSADKKRWGGQYHDGQGLRYYPPQLYIELNDYKGGLRYFNWFNKNFSDDSGYPDFLFEWTIILFKTGKLKDAQKKAFETFRSNTWLFDVFFERQVTKIENREDSNLQTQDLVDNQFCYKSKQENLADFLEWLHKFIKSEKFIRISHKYLEIQDQLKKERDTEKRHDLIQQEQQLENEF